MTIAAVRVEAEQPLQVALLEDPDEHAVGRPDREQVEHDRRQRDHDRAEREQQQQERQPEHEREHERARACSIRSLKSCVPGRLAGDRVADAREPGRASPAGPASAASAARGARPRPRRCRRAGRRPARPCGRRSTVTCDRLVHAAAGERQPRAGRRAPACAAGDVTSGALTTTTAGAARPGTPSGSSRTSSRSGAPRQVAERRAASVHAERGSAEQRAGHRSSAADRRRSDGAARSRRATLRSPFGRCSRSPRPQPTREAPSGAPAEPCGARRTPRSTRSPSRPSSAGSTVSEPDHRDQDDDHRADPERVEDLRAREQHPGHRDQHGGAGDQDGAARRSPRRACSASRPWPARALLALALDVEERVVDADRHAHQQDHRAGGVPEAWNDVAGERPRARSSRAPPRARAAPACRRRRTRRTRAAGSERERHATAARPARAVVDRLAELAVRARVAELRDAKPGEARCSAATARGPAGRVRRRVRGPFISNSTSAEWPSFESWPCVPAASGERTSRPAACVARLAPPRAQVAPEGGIADVRSERALYEHALAGVVVEAGLREDRLRPRGLAGGLLGVGQLHGLRRAADGDRGERRTQATRRWRSSSARRSSARRGRRDSWSSLRLLAIHRAGFVSRASRANAGTWRHSS